MSIPTLILTEAVDQLTALVGQLRNKGHRDVRVNLVELESVLKSINWIAAENQALLRELSKYRKAS